MDQGNPRISLLIEDAIAAAVLLFVMFGGPQLILSLERVAS